MKLTKNKLSFLLFTFSLSACTTTSTNEEASSANNYKVATSYLAGTSTDNAPSLVEKVAIETNIIQNTLADVQNLQPLVRNSINLRKTEQLSAVFSNDASLTISVNEMAIQDFLHYALGELLNVNYIIDKSVSPKKENITLNIKEKISPRRLMQLISELLLEQDVTINFNDGLYFIHKPKKNKRSRNVVTAVGREFVDVPQTAQDILQIVPLKYGVKISIEKALRQLVGVQISTDADQSALFLQGKRDDILRSLEFIHLLDAPANRGKHIALISLTFMESEEFTKQITTLLENEGILDDLEELLKCPDSQVYEKSYFLLTSHFESELLEVNLKNLEIEKPEELKF